MASFRKFTLVAVALVAFAGLLSAASAVSVTSTFAGFRAEGLTEPVPAIKIDVTGLVGGAPATYKVLLLAKGPITSPKGELGLVFGGGAVVANGSTAGTPVVAGASVTIPNVVLNPGAAGTEQILTITGLRVDANAIGANNLVTITVLMVPETGVPNNAAYGVLTQDITFGLVSTSLAVVPSATALAPIKKTVTDASVWGPMTSTIDATSQTAFTATLFSAAFHPTYSGAFSFSAPEALRFTAKLSNLPSGLALWVPTTITVVAAVEAPAAPAITAQLVSGADVNGSGGTLASMTNIYSRVNASGATMGQVTYQLSAALPGQADVVVPFSASMDNTLGLTTTVAPVTLVASYAPLSSDMAATAYTTAPSNLLRFAMTSTQSFSGFLLTTPSSIAVSVPYVVSDGSATGWVTGLAIVNTGSSDTVFTNTGASGTCTLNFFSADGVAAAPAAVTTAAIVPGGTLGFTLNDTHFLGATAYSGPVVVKCNFDNVAVYSYVTGHGTTGVYVVKN
jgi:hypothetical protein